MIGWTFCLSQEHQSDFFYCQLNQVATARGFLLLPERSLDTSSQQSCCLVSFVFYFVFFTFLGAGQPRVAVVREEGSNGDREMSVSLYMAGFEVLIQSSIDDTCCPPLFNWCASLLSTFVCRFGTSPCRTWLPAPWLWTLSRQSCLSEDSATQTSWDQLKAN